MAKTLSDKAQKQIAKASRERELRTMSASERAATRYATKIGMPVGYLGGSSFNGNNVSSGIARPLPALPKLSPSAKPGEDPPGGADQGPAPAPPYNPTPLTPEDEATNPYGGLTINFPEMTTPESKFMPGGVGANLDGGATGYRRKKSSGRLAGRTTKGTSQFKIGGQTAKSSGLNIGV